MKKRLLTLAMAGVMVTGAMAPAAMAANSGNATVSYVAGAGTPDGSDGSYYVKFPADLTFFSKDDTDSHIIELCATSGAVTSLSSTLSVNVNVKGKGVLSATSGSYGTIDYQIDYTDDIFDKNEATNGIDLTLTPTSATKTGNASITSKSSFPVAAKGTVFTDTLTFALTQTSK